GSALKPFVYALAMERGWTPATIIDDSPLLRPVSVGIKQYRNYSGRHYGLVRLREALGNSLNIPAVKAAEFVTTEALYAYLRELGFEGLTKSVLHYGEGLALGNAEVSLFELVRAYSVLARGGVYKNISGLLNSRVESAREKRVVSRAVSSIVGNILSDENARQLEFSGSGLLSFPAQTAVKTGTSSDYRDAWAVGYNDDFTVGVWMGSLDYRPMKQVTGSEGPGIVLRAVFAELNRRTPTAPLFLDPELVRVSVCEATGRAACGSCNAIDELFVPGTMPDPCEDVSERTPKSSPPHIKIQLPTKHLRLALDPRIPDSLEKFPFTIDSDRKVSKVMWYVNDELVGESLGETFLWPLSAGEKILKALVWVGEHEPVWTDNVRFFVRPLYSIRLHEIKEEGA
ncbi:MAG: penicillin-binding protein 1C, partial [Deltaproteobacteria bacterium]|nr:penicillin-binding protein 1C [Deltaproteobacteria bacterium]